MIAYPDTSFLVSLYVLDTNSSEAQREYQSVRPSVLFTPFGELELAAAFEARVFRREDPPAKIRAAFRAVRTDVDAGVLVRKPVPEAAFTRALELAHRHARRIGVRALDILHVAIALELGVEEFLTFDRRQHRLARAVGLKVRPSRQVYA